MNRKQFLLTLFSPFLAAFRINRIPTFEEYLSDESALPYINIAKELKHVHGLDVDIEMYNLYITEKYNKV